MPDSSIGVYTRPSSPTPVTGQGADAPQVNVPIDDIAAALNHRSFRDGRAPMLGNQDFNGYRVTGAGDAVDAQDYVTKAQMEAAIAAISLVAPGIMQPYTISSATAPTGYLFANGQTVSRSTYAALWAAVSGGNNLAASEGVKTVGQYGPGDGSTTFTLPNLYADNGYFIRPISSGRTIGTVQADEVKSHGHSATFAGNPVPNHDHSVGAVFNGSGIGSSGGYITASESGVDTSPAGGHTPSGTVTVNPTGGTETRPKNIAYPVLIKT
jgi:microcystin-dependent protein